MRAAFKPLSFEQWQQDQLENARSDEDLVDCLECDASGECECGECGHERECDECNGQGKIQWGELSKPEKLRLLTRERYAQAVLADANAWASWLGRDPLNDLVAAGFRVWTSVVGRKLGIAPAAEGFA